MFDQVFLKVADAAGAPVDYVKLLLCLITSFPLSAVYPYLSSPTQKHLYSLLVSFLFFIPVLQLKWGFLQLLATSLVTYWICLNKLGGRKMGWIVFILQMFHLTCNHCYRQFGNVPLTTIEITSMQMVSTMNLTTFAWDCFDGQIRSEEECDEGQKKTRITKMPGLLEFLGYVFYSPGVLIGPSTRFADYRAWSNGSLFASPKGKEKEKAHGKLNQMPPGRSWNAFLTLAIGLVSLAVWSVMAPGYGYEKLIGQNGGLAGYSLGSKILFVQMAGFMARLKYYGIWSLTDGACIVSGLGYNGVDPTTGKTKWNRCRNIEILRIEFANNWKEVLDHWNMNTNVWLRNNVFKRVARPGKRPGFKSSMTTFLTSAFWHGLAPGYYLSFLLAGFMQSSARTMRRHFRPFFFSDTRTPNPTHLRTLSQYTPAQLVYCTFSVVLCQMTLNYAVAPFILLEFSASIRCWKALSFYGHFMTLICFLAFSLGFGKFLDQFSGRPTKSISRKKTKTVNSADESDTRSGFTRGAESDGEPMLLQQFPDAKNVSSLAPESIS